MSQKQQSPSSHLLTSLLFALFLAAFPSSVAAAPGDGPLTLNISSGIAGAIYILVGLALVFAGYRLSRFLLFIAGAYILSTLAFIALRNLEPAGGYPSREWVYLGVGIGAGLIGGALFVCFYKLAILGLGAFAGFTLASYILTFQTGSLISSGVGRAVFIIVLCIVGSILAWYFERHAIIVGSSIVGAVSVILGIDVFAGTGVTGNVTQAVLVAEGKASLGFSISTPGYILLASGLLLAIVGMLVQYRTNRGYEFMGGKHHR